MANKLEYTLSLRDRLSGPLTRIVRTADHLADTWAKVQRQTAGADAALARSAKSLGTLRQQAAALRAEREWIPASNAEALRRSNRELASLDRQIRHLETTGNGNRLGAWFARVQKAVPAVGKLTNPLYLIRKGIEAADSSVQGTARNTGGLAAEEALPGQDGTQQSLRSRLDRLASQAQEALAPAFEGIGRMLGNVVAWLEQHGSEIVGILRTVALVAGRAFDTVGRAIGTALDWLGGWMNALREGNLPVIAFTALVGSLAGVLSVCALWEGIVTKAKWTWNTAQQVLNLSLLACPLTWIVAGIVALAAVIGYVAYSTTGWGETWTHTWQYIRLSFQQAGAWLRLKWLETQNAFLTGFELIEKGWYKLQSLWDKDSADAGLARIESARDQRAAEIAKAQGKVEELAQKRRELNVWQVTSNGKTLGDAVHGLQATLGLKTSPATANSLQGAPGELQDFDPGNAAVSAIAGSPTGYAGGGRPSSVTINLQSLVGTLVFEGGYDENRGAMQQDLESALLRVLEIADTAQ